MAKLPRLLSTSTFQLTVLYSTVFAASITIVAAFLYWSTVGYMQSQTDAAIETEVQELERYYRARGLTGLVRAIGDRLEPGGDPSALYLFADRQFNPLAGNLPAWPELAEAQEGWYSFRLPGPGNGIPARARVYILTPQLILLVGREITDLNEIVSIFVKALGWGGGMALVLALAGGFAMSLSVQRRVEQINADTREIIAGDLHKRLPTRGSGDEFDQLAGNFNTTLDELERVFDSLRHVGDGIAHDLRTPVTRLRNALDEAYRAEDPAEVKRRLERAIEDADRLLDTFSALLRIARVESGRLPALERVTLRDLLDDAIDLYSALADDSGVTLSGRFNTAGVVDGDRNLLFQLIGNVLDNAIKYTPAGGDVHVELFATADGSCLEIRDTGPGIPAAFRDRVLDRFYRLDQSRSKPGNGLGLSLVRAVADVHDAALELDDNGPGLVVRVQFPGPGHRKPGLTPALPAASVSS